MTLESFAQWFIDLDLLQRYGPRMLEGLLVTGKLVAISFTLGALQIGRAHV